jgi:hypothetical protein
MMVVMMMVLRGRDYDGDIEGKLQRGETKQKNRSTKSCITEGDVLLKARNF